jgi:hypothetical protein
MTPAIGDQLGTSAQPIDPLFGTLDGRALTLSQDSQAVDAGNPSILPADTSATDARGKERISGGVIDIGSYEHGYDLSDLIAFFFSEEIRANPALEATHYGLEADFDQDGTNTILEIAFGGDPTKPSTANLPFQEIGSLIIVFQLDERLAEFSYTMEGSLRLDAWTSGAAFVPLGLGQGYQRTAGDGSDFVSATQNGPLWTVRERITLGGEHEPRVFGQVRVRVSD